MKTRVVPHKTIQFPQLFGITRWPKRDLEA